MATQKTAPFAAEYEPAENLGRRRSPRAPVSLDARIGRGGLDRTLCKVTDISLHGAGIQTYSELRLGNMIWLSLPKIGHVAAKVVWVGDFEAGVEFQEPLTTEAFEILTSQ
ncbi:MAG: PilZ domain-containing protein [Sphingomonas sp.]|uniref:PilZ domain-containing protein n=1 Tax=Sphingomonas sp. TaxID=28214 RepID=UPI0025EEA0F5|nr:PilZ domain-containing protein [Sphingomonas sp.]MBX3564489.1 PilZ domain-containing protein [Sphingomonas sp.]